MVKKEVTTMNKDERISFLWSLAEKIADQLRSDFRVESVWVCGSLARDEADEFSDLDMAALIKQSSFSEFIQESREEKWFSLGAEGWMDEWGDKFTVKGVCFSIDYITLDRILKCGWEELEHVEWILGGIVHSKIMYDPNGTLKRLKEEFSVYPEQLRKRRIVKLDDDAAMYAYLAECEIKRKYYVKAAYFLRNSIILLAHLLFSLNDKYFLSKRNLLDRINKFNNVPKRFSELFMSILFDLKPNEESMNLALKSIIEIQEHLRKTFDYSPRALKKSIGHFTLC